MAVVLHPTALVDAKAELGADVRIGPYCIIGPKVRIGDRARLISHVAISGPTELGEDCVVHAFAALGEPPQDVKYKGEDTTLIVGPRTVIREHVTMHRGTPSSRGTTRVGADGFFMVGSHIAHDCLVGDKVVFANNGTLGGHVVLGDFVILGGLAAVHQHCRVGRHAFVGAMALVTEDVIPYGSVIGNHAHLAGLNVIGLKRRGYTREAIHDMRACYRLLFAEEGTFQERVEDVARLFAHRPEAMEIVEFIRAPSSRPICMPESR